MAEVTYRKACRCEYATASGPRLVSQETFTESNGVSITFTMHRMVCDACDTPWTLDLASFIDSAVQNPDSPGTP